MIAGRREEVLDEAAAAIGERCSQRRRRHPRARPTPTRDRRRCLERHGRLDVLVNNAGGQYFVPAEAIAAKGWRAVQRLNVGGTLHDDRAPRPSARSGPPAAARSSTSRSRPHHGMPAMAHSGAARAAVEGCTRELAARVGASDGIAVRRRGAATSTPSRCASTPRSSGAGAARTVPLQRLGDEQEHAWLVALLASPLGRALSGSSVTLDGARDNWFGPWPPPTLIDDGGEVPTEERRPRIDRADRR